MLNELTIAFASGKGGTGKTSLAVNFAVALSEIYPQPDKIALFDLDVEEPNTGIYFSDTIRLDSKTISAQIEIPNFDLKKCNYCGKCAASCNFNAISVTKYNINFFDELCKSCGRCGLSCPEDAIIFKKQNIGIIESYKYNNLNVIQGLLNIGNIHSKSLIAEAKKLTQYLINIYDCPPGTTCPMVESIVDADFIILVTEPTPFGLHDLSLANEVVQSLNKKSGVIINKSDSDDSLIENFCQQSDIPVIEKIPFDIDLAKKCGNGELFFQDRLYFDKMKNILNHVIGGLK